ncbi:hypothetical protein ABUK73_13620 [Agrobacterium sp. BA1120]|uniref:hypothetical protein n=1 Tax=Agrobacterium sp. BA1120 TaxID=3228927 RepID=UPI003369FAEB
MGNIKQLSVMNSGRVSVVGVVLLVAAMLMGDIYPIITLLVGFSGTFLILLGAGIEILSYLQQSRADRNGDSDLEENPNSELADLKRKVEALSREQTSGFSKQERIALKKEALKSISDDLQAGLGAYWQRQFQQLDENLSGKKVLRATIVNSRIRLKKEISDLGRRANLNLTIGALISVCGIFFLGYSVLLASNELNGDVNIMHVSFKFVARLSVVAVVQVFAYFFLRLYRYSLYEIKFFQNELTNADLRFSALYSAICFGEKSSVLAIAKLLAQTERNFILKKGETTINLKREELETAHEATILSAVERFGAKVSSHESSAQKRE